MYTVPVLACPGALAVLSRLDSQPVHSHKTSETADPSSSLQQSHALGVSRAALLHQASTSGLGTNPAFLDPRIKRLLPPSISSEMQSSVTPCPPQKPTQVYSKREEDKITNKDLSPFSARSLLETVFLSNFTRHAGTYHLFQRAHR